MSERVNKLYRPNDLTAAIDAVQVAAKLTEWTQAGEVVKALHREGWKLVYVGKSDK